jgi:RNA polymerase-binding protein DksA
MAKSTKKKSSAAGKTTKAKKSAAKKVEKTSKAQVKAKTKTTKEVTSASKTKQSKTKKSETTKNKVREVKTDMVNRKPAYSPKELEYFKQLILEKRKEIIEQLESLRERMLDESGSGFVNENSPYSLHMAEQGTDAFEKEKNYLWAQRSTKFLSYLDAALKRIEEGTYGYCIDCGKVIEKGRLEAVPHTQHCVNCKVKLSK